MTRFVIDPAVPQQLTDQRVDVRAHFLSMPYPFLEKVALPAVS
jgi:hypothetical protein